jgi:hypothetical protein
MINVESLFFADIWTKSHFNVHMHLVVSARPLPTGQHKLTVFRRSSRAGISCHRGRSSLDLFPATSSAAPLWSFIIIYLLLYILSHKNVIIIFLLLHLDIYLIGLIIIIVLKAILRLHRHEKHSGESNKNNHFNQK